MKKYLLTTLMLMTVWVLPAAAQWQFTLSTDQSYDTNPFRYAEALASYVASADVGLQYSGQDLAVSYTGSYNFFEAYNARNYYWHQLALFHEYKNGEWGAFVNQRINDPEYNIYDYATFSLYSTYMYRAAGMNYRWYNQLSYDSYNQLSELNNINFYSGLRVNRSFESGMSVIANGGFTYKQYVKDVTTTGTLNPSVQDGGHWGRGGMGDDNMGFHENSNFSAPSVTKVDWSLRLAHALWEKAGLAVIYKGNYNLSSRSRNVIGLSYSNESLIYDDPTGYNAQSIGTELTWILPLGITWKSGYYYADKTYIAQGVYSVDDSYNEAIGRRDFRHNAWSYLSKRIAVGANAAITPTLRFRWLDNQSNSYYYDYQTTSISLGLNWEF